MLAERGGLQRVVDEFQGVFTRTLNVNVCKSEVMVLSEHERK